MLPSSDMMKHRLECTPKLSNMGKVIKFPSPEGSRPSETCASDPHRKPDELKSADPASSDDGGTVIQVPFDRQRSEGSQKPEESEPPSTQKRRWFEKAPGVPYKSQEEVQDRFAIAALTNRVVLHTNGLQGFRRIERNIEARRQMIKEFPTSDLKEILENSNPLEWTKQPSYFLAVVDELRSRS